MSAAEMEAKMVLFDVVEQVLAATGLKPCQARAVSQSLHARRKLRPDSERPQRRSSPALHVTEALSAAPTTPPFNPEHGSSAAGACRMVASFRNLPPSSHPTLAVSLEHADPDHTNLCHVRVLQIDILITNCSLYCPTPSLSSLVVNHFKMRSNIISYSLGGMGCSAGVIAVGLAKELLQARMPQVCH